MVEQQGHYEDRGDPFKSVSMHMSDHVRDGGETSTAPGKNCEADIADKACVVAILRDRSRNRCHETLFVNPYFSKAFLIGSSYQLNQIDQEADARKPRLSIFTLRLISVDINGICGILDKFQIIEYREEAWEEFSKQAQALESRVQSLERESPSPQRKPTEADTKEVHNLVSKIMKRKLDVITSKKDVITCIDSRRLSQNKLREYLLKTDPVMYRARDPLMHLGITFPLLSNETV